MNKIKKESAPIIVAAQSALSKKAKRNKDKAEMGWYNWKPEDSDEDSISGDETVDGDVEEEIENLDEVLSKKNMIKAFEGVEEFVVDETDFVNWLKDTIVHAGQGVKILKVTSDDKLQVGFGGNSTFIVSVEKSI